MSDIYAKRFHYMAFYHPATGKTRNNWTLVLLKDGIPITEGVDINIEEVKAFYYVVSFKNDGTDNSIWQVFAKEASIEKVYTESWRVKTKNVESDVQAIRANLDSEGGFFGLGKKQ